MSHVRAGDTVLVLGHSPPLEGVVLEVYDAPTTQRARVRVGETEEDWEAFALAVIARKDGSRVVQGAKEPPYRRKA